MQASITTVLLLSQAGQSAKPYRVAVGSYCSINDGICSSAVYTLGFNPPGEDPHTQWVALRCVTLLPCGVDPALSTNRTLSLDPVD